MSTPDSDDFRRLAEQSDQGIAALDAQGRICWCNAALKGLLERPELLGENLEQMLGGAAEEVDWRTPDGRWRHVCVKPIGVTGALRWVAVRDTTAEERTRRHQLALMEVACSLTHRGPSESILDGVAAAVVRATRAEGCSVWLFDERGEKVRMIGSAGLPQNYHAAVSALLRAGHWTSAMEALRRREPVMYYRRERIPALLANPDLAEAHDYFRQSTCAVICSLPLLFGDRALGALNCFYADELESPEDETTFLQAIADQAAVFLESLRQLKGKAVLEERQRIARELHDSVSQALYGIGLGANTALTQADAGNLPAARQALHYLVGLADAAQTEMRSLICELRPEALEAEGLSGLLQRQLTALAARHGFKVQSDLEEPDLPLDTKHALYRVLQEALSNVVRHSHAHQVELAMHPRGRHLEARLVDDGVGFEVTGCHPGHFGLRTMRERVEKQGGQLQVDSVPGRGTTVTVTLPL